MNVFEITAQDKKSRSRRGRLSTAHGTVNTPFFMPVGTRGAVKGITPEQLRQAGSSVILANTYHLMLRPGVEVVEELGGLHKLMGWDGPILTDSGGYQVFSLATLNRVGDEGVEFSSHIDGAKICLNAEIATQIQNRMGADIIMCFDECTAWPCERDALEKAVERTINWAEICREKHNNNKQLLFGIVQGGTDIELRSYCAEKLVEMEFDGYAIGGLSVGEGHENMVRTAEHTTKKLPENKPRYLMGVGMPEDLIAAVRSGVDMFDCVLPTRNGRNAFAFTMEGGLRLRNTEYISDDRPIDAGCGCYCCENFSRGAIRHFFNVNEMSGPILLSIHNITFYHRLMKKIQDNIESQTFNEWSNEFLSKTKIGLKD